MRISDWSSDVCSSDLSRCLGGGAQGFHLRARAGRIGGDRRGGGGFGGARPRLYRHAGAAQGQASAGRLGGTAAAPVPGAAVRRRRGPPADRTSVVSGNRLPVRVDLGGRRLFKKKK